MFMHRTHCRTQTLLYYLYVIVSHMMHICISLYLIWFSVNSSYLSGGIPPPPPLESQIPSENHPKHTHNKKCIKFIPRYVIPPPLRTRSQEFTLHMMHICKHRISYDMMHITLYITVFHMIHIYISLYLIWCTFVNYYYHCRTLYLIRLCSLECDVAYTTCLLKVGPRLVRPENTLWWAERILNRMVVLRIPRYMYVILITCTVFCFAAKIFHVADQQRITWDESILRKLF